VTVAASFPRCWTVWAGSIHHDSLHTWDHMTWEFETAYPHLRADGVLTSDDIHGAATLREVFRKCVSCILSAPWHPVRNLLQLGVGHRLGAARRTALRQIAPDCWVRPRAVGGFHPGLGHGYRVVGLPMKPHISFAQSELALDGTLGLFRHNSCITESVVGSPRARQGENTQCGSGHPDPITNSPRGHP